MFDEKEANYYQNYISSFKARMATQNTPPVATSKYPT